MFVVAATAVMPYSDDGASGEGLLVSCVHTEHDAIEQAVHFMTLFRSKMIFPRESSLMLTTDRLCADADEVATFDELATWFARFHDVVSEYVSQDPHYGNPNHVLNLVIKDVRTNSPVHETFSPSRST